MDQQQTSNDQATSTLLVLLKQVNGNDQSESDFEKALSMIKHGSESDFDHTVWQLWRSLDLNGDLADDFTRIVFGYRASSTLKRIASEAVSSSNYGVLENVINAIDIWNDPDMLSVIQGHDFGCAELDHYAKKVANDIVSESGH